MTESVSPSAHYDAIIVGGGFYGASIATYLSRNRGFERVLVVEAESTILSRASYRNQARVHNGYHYPRSFTTAFRSRVNLPRFLHDFPESVVTDTSMLYAIARTGSKVSARQFARFCREIGADLEVADVSLKALFDRRLVEEVFSVTEYAFDSSILADLEARNLVEAGVEVRLDTRVLALSRLGDGAIGVSIRSGEDTTELTASYVFNCTYSGLNQLSGDFPGTATRLKHEMAELALIRVPPALRSVGITVMDGPFFSCMPFPSRSLHSLSHVRYTPHGQWQDAPHDDPAKRLGQYDEESRVDRMLRDSARYVPMLIDSEYVDSLFEVKTVLVKNETDDGRPILFERHATLPGSYSVLGSKLDNIYDILEKLDEEVLTIRHGQVT